jgi:hypothetical protein
MKNGIFHEKDRIRATVDKFVNGYGLGYNA